MQEKELAVTGIDPAPGQTSCYLTVRSQLVAHTILGHKTKGLIEGRVVSR